MTHTPGPWRIEEGTTLIWGNCDPDDATSYGMGYPVADCQYPRSWRRDRPTDAEIDGNARLIAAAPDLLAIVKEMVEVVEWSERRTRPDWDGAASENSTLGRARIAIAKAETP